MKSDVFSVLNMLACSSGASMARLEAGGLLLDDRTTGDPASMVVDHPPSTIARSTPEVMGNTHGQQPPVASVIGVTSSRPRNVAGLVASQGHGLGVGFSNRSRSRGVGGVGGQVGGSQMISASSSFMDKHQQKLKQKQSQPAQSDGQNLYEDVGQVNVNGPLKITQDLSLSKGKVVIRPIAFKPVAPSSSSAVDASSSGIGSRYSSMPSVNATSISPLFSSSSAVQAATIKESSPSSIGTTNPNNNNNNNGSGSSSSGYFTRTTSVARNFLTGSVTSVNLLGDVGGASVLSVAGRCSSPSEYFSESEQRRGRRTSSQYVGIGSHGSFLLDTNFRSAGGGPGAGQGCGNGGGGRPGANSELDSRSACTYSTTDSCLKLPLSETPSFSYLSDELTPSPSDSGVAELEAMLKEKDSEINYLRETMEQNEQVIFKVYEEKEVGWQKELKRLRGHYDTKLKACQQRALKMEQVLMMQTYQLQQDKRKLRQECDELKREKEQSAEDVRRELELMRGQLEETEWKMCQKSGEISLLKSQMKELQNEQTGRAVELLHVRAELKEAKAMAEAERKEAEDVRRRQQQSSSSSATSSTSHGRTTIEAPEDVSFSNRSQELRRELERLEADVEAAKTRLAAQRATFEEERVRWLDEKEKVIRYQKQLQLNYVQMYRRNRTLESEVEQLTLELEGRDLKLINGESQC